MVFTLEPINITKELILSKVSEETLMAVSYTHLHFHKSQMQTINNTMFKLLNIGEIVRHYSDDNNTL